MTKDAKYRIVITIMLIIMLFEGAIISMGIGLIDDLTYVANTKENEAGVCKVKLNDLMNDYERLQDENR